MYATPVMERFLNPRNSGELPDATHFGQVGIPGDGHYALMWLKVAGGEVVQATFETYPCPAAVACLCLTTELVTGRPVEFEQKLDAQDLSAILGGLPEGKEHCANRAIEVVRLALASKISRS